MKTLYFEGAGWEGAEISKNTIGNCRIRTAFHTIDGEEVFIEIHGCEATKHTPDRYSRFGRYYGFVDYCSNPLLMERIRQRPYENAFPYYEGAILDVLKEIGGHFDDMKVLNSLGGYHVFAEKGGYNYGDEFEYDEQLESLRYEIHDLVYAMEKKELIEDRKERNHKFVHSPTGVYPNFSLWVDENDPEKLHLLRHFNGYNRHWEIKVDKNMTAEQCLATMEEKPLGRYGC